MKDFGPIVYLDLQKTGSSYTMKFFRKTCKLSSVYKDVHGHVGTRYDPTKFYFVTIRHPVSQYVSLFRFGLDGKGQLFGRLRRKGVAADLYVEGNEGFNRWLGFVLDPENAGLVDNNYARAAHLDIGLQTHRFLSFALKSSRKVFEAAADHDDLIARFRAESIVDHVILNENLSAGLKHLATEMFPEHFRQNMVKQFFADETRVNAAKSSSAQLYAPEGAVKALLEHKERFLLGEFYGQATLDRLQTADGGGLRVTGYLDVPSERLDAVRAALPDHVRLTRAEPGCLEFFAEFDADNPRRIQVRERFVDRAAFEAHQSRTRASDWARVSDGIVRHLQIDESPR